MAIHICGNKFSIIGCFVEIFKDTVYMYL